MIKKNVYLSGKRINVKDGMYVVKIISISDNIVKFSGFPYKLFISKSGRYYLTETLTGYAERVTISDLIHNYAVYSSLNRLTVRTKE